ncbi:unnamed protein product [Cylicocyclus nassatus]|uniref:RING-type domain-containing protein n=1 Tax=Cylicocyclus nassatus TaxID=53992 RepID=A0AA36H4P0_CYLNA|nr:unnamed protein product [Cylicocyclus nassatus]
MCPSSENVESGQVWIQSTLSSLFRRPLIPLKKKMQGVTLVHRSASALEKPCSSSEDDVINDDVSRSLRRLSSLPADFCCSICMNIFTKPSMLSCGHSFCAKCIQHWLNENISCPTCRMGTQLPIRNIALEQVVEEFRLTRQYRMAHSLKTSGKQNEEGAIPLYRRQLLRASRRRARLSVLGTERIVDGPGSSMEVLPTSSREGSCRSLSSLPQIGHSGEHGSRTNFAPRRHAYRNVHDSWSGRMGQLYSIYDSEASETAPSSEFKRASLLRRSICAIRKSVSRRHRKRDSAIPCSGTGIDNEGFVTDEAEASNLAQTSISSAPIENVTKPKKSKWKRFFPFRLRKVHPSNDHSELSPYGPLCVYSGFGRTFERINPGEEIAIAVFGARGVGKTSLLDNATLSCEGRQNVSPIGLTERMRLGGRQNHNEYRFAHMTSMTVRARHHHFMVDLIDAEFEDDHSITHTSYMRAADAAIIVFSTADSGSLLMAMSINRQLAGVSDSKKPCVLLANLIDDIPQRYVTREMGEKTARNIRAHYLEASLLAQDGGVYEAIEHLCRAVVAKRKNSDVSHTCAIM